MRITTKLAAATVAAAGAVSIVGIPTALADDAAATTYEIGQQAKLVNGDNVQGWTITDLKASTDVIPYQVSGTLWEATATDEALQGAVTPIVSNLNARATDGGTYRALFQVAAPEGVNPSTLPPGQKTTGKVYFDVTGENPDSVVYNAGGRDLLVWVQPEPSQGQSGSQSTPAPAGRQTAPAPASNQVTPAPQMTPVPAGNQLASAPAGSVGTPLPAGSAGTPLPAGAPGAPVPAVTDPALVPAGSPGAPLPAGSAGTPLPAGTAGAPLPASVDPALVPGVPHGPSVPTTTLVPVPANSHLTP